MCGCHIPHLIHITDNKNTKQAAGIEEGPSSPQPAACPRCHQMVGANFTWCPYCGSALKDHACRYCQQKVQAQDLTCRFCGAPA